MVDDDTLGALAIEQASWGRDGGFRAAIGKNVVNSPWDISFEFTYISSGDVKDLFAEDSRDAPLWPLFTNRDGEDLESVNVRSETDLEVIYGDIMARYKVRLGDDFIFGMGGGLRFAIVEDDRLFTATGDQCDADILDIDNDNAIQRTIFNGCAVSQREDYWGVGPRLQTSVAWAATDRLNIFVNLGFSILAGELDRRTDEHGDNDFNDDRTILQAVRGQIVPVVDSQIGISYQSGNLGFKLGYEFQNWFDLHDRTLTHPVFDDDDGDPNGGAIQNVSKEDIGFEGPFLRATMGF